MAKLPYMQFYPADWIRDTRALSISAKGAWIEIICAMWNSSVRGEISLSIAALSRAIGATDKATVKALREIEEHQVCDVEWLENDRVTLRSRRIIREAQVWQSKSESARKAVNIRWGKPDTDVLRTHYERNTTSDTRHQTPEVQERATSAGGFGEPEPEAHIPTLQEVQEQAKLQGVTPEVAQKFFDHYEGNNLWLNGHGRLINWQLKLPTWQQRERTLPAKSPAAEAPGRPRSVWELKSVIEAKEKIAKALKDRHTYEAAMGVEWDNEAKKAEYRKLRAEIKELNNQIAKTA